MFGFIWFCLASLCITKLYTISLNQAENWVQSWQLPIWSLAPVGRKKERTEKRSQFEQQQIYQKKNWGEPLQLQKWDKTQLQITSDALWRWPQLCCSFVEAMTFIHQWLLWFSSIMCSSYFFAKMMLLRQEARLWSLISTLLFWLQRSLKSRWIDYFMTI